MPASAHTQPRQASAVKEQHIPGVTHDTVLRPVGTLMVVFGAIWSFFVPMAIRAGLYGEVKGAAALIVVGLLLATIGKAEQQI